MLRTATRAIPALAALLALSVACGGSSPTSPSLTLLPSTLSVVQLTRGAIRATIDGARWESTTVFGSTGVFAGTPGTATISGGMLGSAFVLTISTLLAPGTYTIGGSGYLTGDLSEGFASRWSAAPWTSGSSGTVTVTTASPTRVAGTFAFTAVATIAGTSPATRTVMNGAFDVFQ